MPEPESRLTARTLAVRKRDEAMRNLGRAMYAEFLRGGRKTTTHSDIDAELALVDQACAEVALQD
jgi:hypothetical protein